MPTRKLNATSNVAAALPAIITDAGESAARRFLEFFAATIRNANTRAAYARAVGAFLRWCYTRGLALNEIDPFTVAEYVERLGRIRSKPTVKQHLAAIRMLFDWLVTGHIVELNPAWSVRGPRHSIRRGLTPVLTAQEARALIESIDTADIAGLRDRALIGLLVYTFSRISAALDMRVEDYYAEGKRWWVRLHEKGGKSLVMPVHHKAEEYLDAYIEAAGIDADRRGLLFRSVGRDRRLTSRPLTRHAALRAVKRRARAAGLSATTCCHTFRATGITVYLENGGTLENAQVMAGHDSIRSTKLYDRTSDAVTLDEVERIVL